MSMLGGERRGGKELERDGGEEECEGVKVIFHKEGTIRDERYFLSVSGMT